MGTWRFFCNDHKKRGIFFLWSVILAILIGLLTNFIWEKISNNSSVENIHNNIEPFTEDIYGIIVGPFFGGSTDLNETGKSFQHTVASTLKATYEELSIKEIEVAEYLPDSSFPRFNNHQEARSFGEKFNAEMVIWGDVTIQGVIPKLTIVKTNGYADRIAENDISIFKNTYRIEFIESLSNIKLPFIVKEPNMIAFFVLGAKFFDAGEYEKAIEYLKRTLQIDPLTLFKTSEYIDESEIFNLIGMSQYMLEKYEAANSSFLTAYNINPTNFVSGVMLGVTYDQLGEEGKAIEIVRRSLTIRYFEENPEQLEYITDLSNGNYDEIIKKQTKIISKSPTEGTSEAFLSRAIAYFKKEEYNKSINDLTESIKNFPSASKLYWIRGIAYSMVGHFEGAVSDFNKYESLGGEFDPETYTLRATAYMQLNNNDKALLDYNKALEVKPDIFKVRMYRGMIYTDNQEYEKAIVDYEAALKLNPPDEMFLYFYLGVAYLQTDNIEKAVYCFSKVTHVDELGVIKEAEVEAAKAIVEKYSDK